MIVPRNVGPPPINPSFARNEILGFSRIPVSGPAIPNPSDALWAPNPTIKTTARAIEPEAYDWPIARPSLRVCNPMLIAIIVARLEGLPKRLVERAPGLVSRARVAG